MSYYTLVKGSILSTVNSALTLFKNENHPELYISQTHQNAFNLDIKIDFNWKRGFYFVHIAKIQTKTQRTDKKYLNAILHGKEGSNLKLDHPDGIHCKNIVNEFRQSGSLKKILVKTNLDPYYIPDADYIEAILDDGNYEVEILS